MPTHKVEVVQNDGTTVIKKKVVADDGTETLVSLHDPGHRGTRGPYKKAVDSAEVAQLKAMKKSLKEHGLAADANSIVHGLDCPLTFTKKSSAERHMFAIVSRNSLPRK